jgi:hypothetical protein
MAIFDFPYHKFSTEYPDNGFQAKLGGSYQYSAPPSAPDQRIFKLKFKALKYFTDATGAIDQTQQPEINLARLEAFYNLYKRNLTFIYPHPVLGELPVRFNKPLVIPEGKEGGDGAVENIEIEFIEQPGLADSGVADMIQIQYVDFPD